MSKIIPETTVAEIERGKEQQICDHARNGRIEDVRRMIYEEGVSVNSINHVGRGYKTAPLECAIWGNKKEMIMFLLDSGADPMMDLGGGGQIFQAPLDVDSISCLDRLQITKLFVEKNSEIVGWVVNRISYLKNENRLDETANTAEAQTIIAEFQQLHQEQLERQRSLKELEEQTRKTLGLDKDSGRNSSGETQTTSSRSDEDPNHKNPNSKVKPNPTQSSPVVPIVTNSGCIIS